MKQETIDKRAIALRENLKKRKALSSQVKSQNKEDSKQDKSKQEKQDAKS